MARQSNFHPFAIDQSWYETYWLAEAPAHTRKPANPRTDWLGRLIAGLVHIRGEWRAHMAAATQARLHRTSLDEI